MQEITSHKAEAWLLKHSCHLPIRYKPSCNGWSNFPEWNNLGTQVFHSESLIECLKVWLSISTQSMIFQSFHSLVSQPVCIPHVWLLSELVYIGFRACIRLVQPWSLELSSEQEYVLFTANCLVNYPEHKHDS